MNRLLISAFIILISLGTCALRNEARSPRPDVKIQNIRDHLRQLAGDHMTGRAPGSKGASLAAEYIAEQFHMLHLQPTSGDSYYQMVPMVGMSVDQGIKMEFHSENFNSKESDSSDSRGLALVYGQDFMAWPGVEEEHIELVDVPVVFLGFGIHAPEIGWNDYGKTDVRGKVVLVLVNEPTSDDPHFFGGKALTYYGRWDYKLEEAARQGASGIILIHNTEMASYAWNVVKNSWGGEQLGLPREGSKSTAVQAWVQQETAEKLFQSSGLSFERARQLASKPGFEPVELGLQLSVKLDSKLRAFQTPNVIGKLEGADPERKEEVVILTTHYDHLGIGPEVDGDSIYNGAFDNASGTAVLIELARVLSNYVPRLRRSILFAAVTGEEAGLLGSTFYTSHPLVPLSKTIANINFDSVNLWGETEDIVAMGAEESTILESVTRVLDEMGLALSPEPFPEQGNLFRSDQFSFMKVGIPVVYFDFGLRFRRQPEGWGKRVMDEYYEQRYHQPGDEYDPTWSMQGTAQMAEVFFRITYYLSVQDRVPQWNSGKPSAWARRDGMKD